MISLILPSLFLNFLPLLLSPHFHFFLIFWHPSSHFHDFLIPTLFFSKFPTCHLCSNFLNFHQPLLPFSRFSHPCPQLSNFHHPFPDFHDFVTSALIFFKISLLCSTSMIFSPLSQFSNFLNLCYNFLIFSPLPSFCPKFSTFAPISMNFSPLLLIFQFSFSTIFSTLLSFFSSFPIPTTNFLIFRCCF